VVDGQADVDVQLPQQRGRDGQGHVSLEGSGDVPVDLRRVTRRQSHNRPRLFVSQSGELVTWLSTRLTLQTRPAKVLEIFMSHERSFALRHNASSRVGAGTLRLRYIVERTRPFEMCHLARSCSGGSVG